MPSAKELAKALARQDSVTQQPRNRFLGAIADAAGYVSDQADRYVVPERDPLLGGMRGGDLLPLRNVNRLLDDLSYGGRITTGRGQTTALRPEVVDLAGVTGAMNPIGKAALKKAAEQIHTGTGVLGRNVIDPRQRMFAGEGAKTADHGALKVAKDMQAAGVPDEQIHAKTKWTFAFADGKPRFEIDDSGATIKGAGNFEKVIMDAYDKGLMKTGDQLYAPKVSDVMFHNQLREAYPKVMNAEVEMMPKSSKSLGRFMVDDAGQQTLGVNRNLTAKQAESTTLHELQHAIQHREGFAKGGSPEMFKKYDQSLLNQENDKYALAMKELIRTYKESGKSASDAMNSPQGKILGESLNRLQDAIKSPYDSYRRLAGEAEARLTQARMNMTAPERAASYPPSMFDVPVKDQIVRYGDNVGGAMMQRPKTEFEILHDTAQRNAALPVEQGGLGLPANNTYIDRANVMYPTDAYHGGNSLIKEADYNYSGKGKDQYGSAALYTGSDPSIANSHVNQIESGGNVMPLRINREGHVEHDKAGNLTASQIKNLIKASPDEYALSNFGDVGYEGANKVLGNAVNSYKDVGDGELLTQMNMINNDFYTGQPQKFNEKIGELTGIKGLNVDVGGGKQFHLPYNPESIRSRFAAFDPMRRHEADILAGVGVSGMLDPQAIAEALRQQDRK